MEETLKLLTTLDNLAGLRKYEGGTWEWCEGQFTHFFVNVHDPPLHGDAFVCCVMSHGEKGCVFGIDGRRLRIKDITATFTRVDCPLLDKKPKVFFIQACQTERAGQPGGQAGNTAEGEDGGAPSWMVVKAEADFLVAMATVGNHEAKRHMINGTWFMQCLCRRLKELCPR